jgi:hypothetical protein
MLCALTVRNLKPDATIDQLREAMEPAGDERPEGWKRFFAIRNVNDEKEVITFGLFDGTLEDLRASQDEYQYAARRQKADELIKSVGADGIYEVVEERVFD